MFGKFFYKPKETNKIKKLFDVKKVGIIGIGFITKGLYNVSLWNEEFKVEYIILPESEAFKIWKKILKEQKN